MDPEETKMIIEAGSAVGSLFEKLFPGIKARSTDNAASSAIRNTMDDIDSVLAWADKNNMPQEMRDCLLNMTLEKHGSNQRVKQCLEFAEPLINNDEDVENLDQEWLDYWKTHAEKSREQDIQAIWGAILAGEVNEPGAVSKRTMRVLADMSRDEAEAFRLLCSRCIAEEGSGLLFPVFIEPGEEFAIETSLISKLRNCGLVEFTTGAGFKQTIESKCEPAWMFSINGQLHIIIGNGVSTLSLTRYPFTDAGTRLAQYCQIGCAEGFKKFFVESVKEKGFTIGEVEETLPNRSVRYKPI